MAIDESVQAAAKAEDMDERALSSLASAKGLAFEVRSGIAYVKTGDGAEEKLSAYAQRNWQDFSASLWNYERAAAKDRDLLKMNTGGVAYDLL